MAVMGALLLAVLAGAAVAEVDTEKLRATTCTNLGAVLGGIAEYKGETTTPYPPYGHDVSIADEDCYVKFTSEDGLDYELLSASSPPMTEDYLLTHTGPCGACSPLDQLALYLSVPDLTTPVSQCALLGVVPFFGEHLARDCLSDLGFRGACLATWYYNTAATRTACLAPCLAYAGKDNIEEVRAPFTSNYCKPCTGWWCPTQCKNKINGAPACDDFQWQNGPFRLNPCLQCDECRAGPIFQKVAGRTRRSSGIISAIPRPDQVPELDHTYGGRFDSSSP